MSRSMISFIVLATIFNLGGLIWHFKIHNDILKMYNTQSPVVATGGVCMYGFLFALDKNNIPVQLKDSFGHGIVCSII